MDNDWEEESDRLRLVIIYFVANSWLFYASFWFRTRFSHSVHLNLIQRATRSFHHFGKWSRLFGQLETFYPQPLTMSAKSAHTKTKVKWIRHPKATCASHGNVSSDVGTIRVHIFRVAHNKKWYKREIRDYVARNWMPESRRCAETNQKINFVLFGSICKPKPVEPNVDWSIWRYFSFSNHTSIHRRRIE